MTKVTMLVTSELDRDPRVTKTAQRVHEAGYEVNVICRSYNGCPKPYQVLTFDTSRKNTLLDKVLERSWTNIKLLQMAIATHPDIIHANDLDTVPAGYLAARLSGAKILYDAHELWSEAGEKGGALGRRLALWIERFLCHRVDAVVAVSRYRAKHMEKMFGITTPTVVMNAPPYVETSRNQPQPWIKDFQGKKVVLYQGRYVAGMGLEDAIRAAKQFPSDIVLVLRGYGPIEEQLRRLVTEERLNDRVFFVPPVAMDELVNSAIGADLGLVTYRPVNMNNLYAAPNKMFEFIMAGVPCVGSDLPYIREILVGNDLGVVFTPGDINNIASVILGIVCQPDKLNEMKRCCLAIAPQFSWQAESTRLINEYERILGKKAPNIP